jgi:DNA-binding MarR family transcriptional regulator
MPNGTTPTTGDGGFPFEIPQTPFGQAVGFLIAQLGMEVTRRFGLIMSEVGLEPRQWSLLRAVADAEGQSQNALGDSLSIPPSSMVALVDQLEERGLVERRPDPVDRRSRRLYITPKGRHVIEDAWELAVGFERRLCAGFTPKLRERLIEMLSRVVDNLDLTQGSHPGSAAGHDSTPATHGPWRPRRAGPGSTAAEPGRPKSGPQGPQEVTR